jgi:hypothetical protein
VWASDTHTPILSEDGTSIDIVNNDDFSVVVTD